MVKKSSGTDIELMLLDVSVTAHDGYGIIVALRDRSNGEFDFAEGTIYPALHDWKKPG